MACECDGLRPADYHCPTCHETFSTDRNFMRHRGGKYEPNTRFCRSTLSVGLVKNRFGRWGSPGKEGRFEPTAALG